MDWIKMAVIAFVLFFLYDWNSISWNNRILQKFFMTGSVLLVVATAGVLLGQKGQGSWKSWQLFLILLLFLLCLILLIYTLFFALPFEETYLKDSQERRAYTEKMYALCRHPGVLWLAGVMAAIAIGKWNRMTTMYCLIVTVCNICYVIYQDILIFPHTFENYGSYQKTTPFLIPTRKSIQKCKRDYHDKGKER